MNLNVENDREEDGRWIAEVRELPGVTSYGATKQDAVTKVRDLASKVIAEQRLQSGKTGKVKLTVVIYQKPTNVAGKHRNRAH